MQAVERQAYRARWIFPVVGEPIEDGTLHVEQGQVVDVSAADDPAAFDLGNVALVPALVNAHTHLEFSDLTEPLQPPRPFTAWVQTVLGHRRQRSMPPAGIIARGLQECSRSGAAQIGEITTDETALAILEKSPVAVTCFREVIGLDRERMSEGLAIAERFLRGGAANGNGRASGLQRGLSPHAPYSVHPELFHKLVEIARQHGAPVAVHIAETQAEVQFLERGTGPFVTLLRTLGLWQPGLLPSGCRTLDYLRPLGDLERALVIHGNYLAEDDVRFLAGHPSLTVVYCPRTHSFFGHGPHPWLELLARGASVALGTDSRASNPDLSLWNELLFLRQKFPQLDPRILLRLGTAEGARALHGSGGILRPGAPADVAVIELSRAEGDAYGQLFDRRTRIAGTMRAGCWIERADGLLECSEKEERIPEEPPARVQPPEDPPVRKQPIREQPARELPENGASLAVLSVLTAPSLRLLGYIAADKDASDPPPANDD